MVRYLYRNCRRCKGYVRIVLREPGLNTPLQAANGQCLRCSYRWAWIVIQGNNRQDKRTSPHHIASSRQAGRPTTRGKPFLLT